MIEGDEAVSFSSTEVCLTVDYRLSASASNLLERHRAGTPLVQGDVDDRDRRLQWCEAIQLPLNHVRIGVTLEVDDDASAVLLAGEVLDVGDVGVWRLRARVLRSSWISFETSNKHARAAPSSTL